MTFISSKAIVVIITLYASSFALLAMQFAVADVFGLTLTSPVTGLPLKSYILNAVQPNSINALQQNVTSTTRNQVVTSGTIGLGMVWEVIQLMLGGYIFNIFIFFGIPSVWVNGFLVVYYVLITITFIALILGRFI